MGADGALVRQHGGSWEPVRVLSAPPSEANRAESAASRALLLVGPVLAFVLWSTRRRLWPSWSTGVAVAAVGWLATVVPAGAMVLMAGNDTNVDRVVARVAVPGLVITTVAALIVARRPARSRPPAPHPPPTSPPPSPPTS